ncbi:unnamed protein product [Sphagnum tenellum]
MEEQTLSVVLHALRKGRCIAILDSKSREAEIDLFFLVRCFMLCKDGDDFGALPPNATKAWALGKNIPFLIGLDIINVFQGGARS